MGKYGNDGAAMGRELELYTIWPFKDRVCLDPFHWSWTFS